MRCARILFFGLSLSGLLGAASCAGELSGDPASYRAQLEPGCNVIPVFSQHCASAFCHGGAQPQAGLDLGSPGVRNRLVGVASTSNGCQTRLLIDPADVDGSVLLEKLESSSPSCGQRMPLTGDISEGERACIRTWATALVGPSPKMDSGGAPPGSSEAGTASDTGAPSTIDAGGTP